MIIKNSILDKYNRFIDSSTLTHIRVTIREDEDFGEGIVECVDGTPSTVSYDKEKGTWN